MGLCSSYRIWHSISRNYVLIAKIGDKFSHLTVYEWHERNSDGKRQWLCLCDCGNPTPIPVQDRHLRSGHSKSCGCIRNNDKSKHGHRSGVQTKTYTSWIAMKKRCLDSPDYAGRGIKVCERWGNFENFLSDMGERPKSHTLERIDVNKDYEPSNCRWANDVDQANNKRTTIFIDGVPFAIACRAKGINYMTAYSRYRKGWSIERIFGDKDAI